MLAGALSPVYPCHVSTAQMRTKPIGTGPFKFAELKQNELMKVVRNPDYWKPGRPYLDAIEFTIIANRATSMLAFTAGKFDLTFTAEIAAPALKDLKTQAPWAICEMLPTNTQANLLVNRDKPPFDDAQDPQGHGAGDRPRFLHPYHRPGHQPHRRHHAAAAGRPLGHAGGVPGHRGGLRRRPREGARRGPQDHGRAGLQRRQAAQDQGFDPQHPDLPRPGGDPDRPSEAGLHPGRARAARHGGLVQPHGAQGLHRRA